MKRSFMRWVYMAAVLVVALAGLAVWPASQVRVDNRIEKWLDSNGESAERYDQFRSLFGTDEFVLVAYSDNALFDAEMLAAQREVCAKLEGIENVESVLGLTTVIDAYPPHLPPKVLESMLVENLLCKGLLLSDDGTTAGILIYTNAPSSAEGRRRLVSDISDVLAPLKSRGLAVSLVGPPVLNVVLDQNSEQESNRVLPIALVCSILILLYAFRSIRATFVAIACAGVTILLTLGLLAATGHTLNMVTAALPALLWVLSLSAGIHLLRRYQSLCVDKTLIANAAYKSVRDTVLPCVLSGITTALGFLSLNFATMAPVRELGTFAAIGILISLLVNFSMGPALIVFFRLPVSKRRYVVSNAWTGILSSLPERYPKSLLFAGVLCGGITLFSLWHIRVESNPLEFLPEDSQTVRDYENVSKNLTGVFALELIVNTPGGWETPAYRDSLKSLQVALTEESSVARVVSPLDFETPLIGQSGGEAIECGATVKELGSHFISKDGEYARFSVLLNAMGSEDFKAVSEKASALLHALPAPLTGWSTGIVPRLVEAQLDLVHTQLKSFAFAFLVVFCCVLVGLRSFRLMLVSILPNILPVLSAFAVMAWWGIALDAGTVMVASIALGIAVDDTVHLLAAHREAMGQGRNPQEATAWALERVSAPMVITTATACAGFIAISHSSFVPIACFGGLSAVAMLTALLTDLFLAPALLNLLPWNNIRTVSQSY